MNKLPGGKRIIQTDKGEIFRCVYEDEITNNYFIRLHNTEIRVNKSMMNNTEIYRLMPLYFE